MVTFIAAVLILAIVGSAGYYVYRAKKRGDVCIGCPEASVCPHKGACSGGCSGCSGSCAGK